MATPTEVVKDAPGMPQLDLSTFPNQIFWLVVTLVVIYFVLSKIALPRIGGALADRAQTITDDLATAEELKQKAVEAEAAYEKALAEARIQAQAISADMRADIQAQLDAEMAKADAEISAKSAEAAKILADIRDSATDSVKTVASDTVQDIVKAMGGSVSAKDAAAAVANEMQG
ncbi:MAG: F0F1 ATP synthase subunit B' [Pseudomonadota bacterium]